MSTNRKAVWVCLGVIAVLLAGTAALTGVDWAAAFANLRGTIATQSEKTHEAMFRLGELMSIGAELKERYGVEPAMNYETGADGRVLEIAFSDYALPEDSTAESHAREIATFAIGRTKKSDRIDMIQVLFESSRAGGVDASSGRSPAHSFALSDLLADKR